MEWITKHVVLAHAFEESKYRNVHRTRTCLFTLDFFLREVHLFYTGTLVSGKRRVLWKTAVPTVKPQQERKFSFSQTATPLRRLAPTVVQTVKYYFPASLFLFKLFIPIQLNKGLLLNYLEEGRTSSNWVNKKNNRTIYRGSGRQIWRCENSSFLFESGASIDSMLTRKIVDYSAKRA